MSKTTSTADTANKNFKYPPIDHHRRQIRVLVIHDFRKRRLLDCSLTTISLDESPHFIALSYVWGSDTPNNIIIVNGTWFRVRDNLFNFLMRVGKEEFIGVPIFVDAICINQNCTTERNHQVSLMRDVYSRAMEVVAWSGSHMDVFGWHNELNGHVFGNIRESRRGLSTAMAANNDAVPF